MKRVGRDTLYLLLGIPVSTIAFSLFLTAAASAGRIFQKLRLPPDEGDHRRVLAVLTYLAAVESP
jgi:hypothetical protein